MGTVTMWHGTVKHAADEIAASGLKPNPKAAFKVNLIANPCEGCVYLSTEPDEPKMFAQFRAVYDKTQPGESGSVSFPELTYWRFRKRDDAPMTVVGKDETPTILRFEIPKEEVTKFQKDLDSLKSTNLTCKCEIPAKYIKEVRVLRAGQWQTVN